MRDHHFAQDDRGAIAVNIAVFFGTILLGAMLAIVIKPAVMDILDIAAMHTSTQAATDGQQYVRSAWNNLHFIVIGAGVLQLVAAAVHRSRRVA